jgi:hypothetical protein
MTMAGVMNNGLDVLRASTPNKLVRPLTAMSLEQSYAIISEILSDCGPSFTTTSMFG